MALVYSLYGFTYRVIIYLYNIYVLKLHALFVLYAVTCVWYVSLCVCFFLRN